MRENTICSTAVLEAGKENQNSNTFNKQEYSFLVSVLKINII